MTDQTKSAGLSDKRIDEIANGIPIQELYKEDWKNQRSWNYAFAYAIQSEAMREQAERIAELEASISTDTETVVKLHEKVAELEASVENWTRGYRDNYRRLSATGVERNQLKSKLAAQSSTLVKAQGALIKIASMQGTESDERDAVERLIPEMCLIASKAIEGGDS